MGCMAVMRNGGKMVYTEHDLVRIAKRENNTKRSYLVVDPLQGKHMPVKASRSFTLFYQLADQLASRYAGERLLFIGFAETATAIGAAVAHRYGKKCRCRALYMQTTREETDGVQYLYFCEEHSHATEQKLIQDDLDAVDGRIDRIVFVEDEVTTGNTIMHIISLLSARYPAIKKYAAASLLNGMDREAMGRYADRRIDLHYLVKTDHSLYADRADSYQGDGKYVLCRRDIRYSGEGTPSSGSVREILFRSRVDVRRLIPMEEYDSEIARLWEEVRSQIDFRSHHSVLVLGTEEFMYPALRISEKIEEIAGDARCHSTTRSPIVVSREEDYPLHTRYELPGLYDRDRRTFIYDLAQYDRVLVITDAPLSETAGLIALTAALQSCGNDDIYVVRWCLP